MMFHCVYTTFCLSVSSNIYGYFFLPIVNNASVNIGIQISKFRAGEIDGLEVKNTGCSG